MSIYYPEQHHRYNIAAFDPGLINIGVAIYTVDAYAQAVIGIEAFTLWPERWDGKMTLSPEFASLRREKLDIIDQMLMDVLRRYKVTAVCHESAFYNSRRPGAFEALTLGIECLTRAVYRTNPYITIAAMPPLVIKQAIGAEKLKGKDSVLTAVRSHQHITQLLDTDLLDEHAIDATAIGYAYCKGYNLNV